MNKSFSESNISMTETEITPPSYVALRNKRLREEDLPEEFNKFKEEIKDLLKSLMSSQQIELKSISSELKEIKTTNNNIESSIALLSSQNEEFRKRIDTLEKQAKQDREYMILLEDKIEDLQRGTRKNCFEIKNVPKIPQENREDLLNLVQSLAKTIDQELNPRDIMDIYRIKGRREGVNNSPVIVELGSALLKKDVLKKCKDYNIKNKTNKLQAKHLGLKVNGDTPVFITEQLTAKGSRLYFLARDLIKTNKVKFCWTSFGNVYIRKNENSPIILIKSEAQIHKLTQEL